jgi:ABC-type lipoprotein release transport system permease subunit
MDDDHMIEALAANGSHYRFDIGTLPRRARCRQNFADTHVSYVFSEVSSGAKLAAVGCGLGLLGAVAASRLLRSFLFEVSPFDPGVLSLSAIAMLLLALAASALPARRASSTDLMLTLRGE